MLSTLAETNFNYSLTLDLSSANAFNLDQSKNLSFGKDVKREIVISAVFNLSSANAFNLVTSKILSFGKGLNVGYKLICLYFYYRYPLVSSSIFSILIMVSLCPLNPFPNKPWFLRGCSASFLKTLWEKEKLLETSNFSFSHSVFYLFEILSSIFIKFEIVVCKLFQFGKV